MAEAADEPGPTEAIGCGRAVVIPDTGSVFVAGHNPLGALFFLAAQAAASLPFEDARPLGCEEDAEMVEVLEACDESEEAEFVRWTLFRGINIAPPPLGTLSAVHACRFMFWKFTGGATAVIGDSESAGTCG